MSIQQLPNDGSLACNSKCSTSHRRSAASYERELLEHLRIEGMLKEAIAQVKVLLRQKEALIDQFLSRSRTDYESAAQRVAQLTPRQRQIMDMVLAGYPSKNIAADIGISQRTVEKHRAEIMKRTGSKSLPALAPIGACRQAGCQKHAIRSRGWDRAIYRAVAVLFVSRRAARTVSPWASYNASRIGLAPSMCRCKGS
jgi:DNA-binding NarL/FixJ family response regulator